jgi:pSer/pThr/pTyr-binding forkhead associated (FHA) protein
VVAASTATEPVVPKLSRSASKRIPTTLTVTEGSLAGTTLTLMEAGVLLGRNPECTLVLDDDFASGRHARIFRRDGGWVVEDLGSTNGTYMGSTRLTQPTPVEVGSTLRIGKTIFELRK